MQSASWKQEAPGLDPGVGSPQYMSTETPEDTEMASLGVDSSYIDAFAGRVPESVLEKHYLDYSPKVEADLR